MDKIYTDAPHNFSEIASFVITDSEVVAREIIMTDKCYFYDTCSFRNHMLASNTNLIFEYIKATSGIVVITRTVIMELCSNDGKLWEQHIEYIRNMHSEGIKIVVVYEEDLFKTLHTYCSDVSEINRWLSYAVKNAKSKAGSLEQVIGQDARLKKMLFQTEKCEDNKLAEKLFKSVRASKQSGDNMGEEMIAVCVHWLSRMRESCAYKYIIFSDDKRAIRIFGKVINNSREFSGQDMISEFSTAKLCYHMKLKGIVTQEEQVLALFSKSNVGDALKVFCSEEFELSPAEKTMSIEVFAKKVITQNIKIYY